MGRVEVTATVVNVAPAQSAMANARWLLARNGTRKRDRGLAIVEVNRQRKTVVISYLKN